MLNIVLGSRVEGGYGCAGSPALEVTVFKGLSDKDIPQFSKLHPVCLKFLHAVLMKNSKISNPNWQELYSPVDMRTISSDFHQNLLTQ